MPPKCARTFDHSQIFHRTISTSPVILKEERTMTNLDADVNDREFIHTKYYKQTDTGGLTATEYFNGFNEADTKRLKVLKLEYEVSLASGEYVPENMTDESWLQVWDCPGRSQRRKFYRFVLYLCKV
jgi:hypothetical protein